MTLLDRILARGVAMPVDPIIAARIDRHLRRIQPDPLFRRRLRGQVLNRYVAVREGLLPVEPARPGQAARLGQPARARRREMSSLGRGVLYASLLTVLSATAAGAASQESLPGDALYGVKLELEEIRMQIAPPALRDDLAAIALGERLEEVEKLAESGRWSLVDEAAARVAIAGEELIGLAGPSSAGIGLDQAKEQIQKHAERLVELMATAPESARDGLERALEASTSHRPPAPAEPSTSQPRQGTTPPSNGEDTNGDRGGSTGAPPRGEDDNDKDGSSSGAPDDADSDGSGGQDADDEPMDPEGTGGAQGSTQASEHSATPH